MLGDDVDHLDGQAEVYIKSICLDAFRANLEELLAQQPSLSEAQCTEIRARAATTAVGQTHIRHFTGTSQVAYHKQVRAAFTNHTAPAEHMSDCPFLTFCVTHNGYRGPHAVAGEVYCIIYTDAGGWITSVPKESRIPKENGKSIFTIHDVALRDTAVAATTLAMPPAALASPTALETYLRNHLRLWSMQMIGPAPMMDNCISANEDRFVFAKRTFHYTGPRSNDIVTMFGRLNTEFGIRMDIKYGRSAATHFNVKTISWERV
jgi:hypothetical protein